MPPEHSLLEAFLFYKKFHFNFSLGHFHSKYLYLFDTFGIQMNYLLNIQLSLLSYLRSTCSHVP